MTAEIRKYVLYAILAILAVFIWNAWDKQQTVKNGLSHSQSATAVQSTAAATTTVPSSGSKQASDYAPQAYQAKDATQGQALATATKSVTKLASSTGELVKVKTDVFDIAIDMNSGNLVNLALPKYPVSVKQKDKPYTLLNTDKQTLYVAQSGLIGANGKPVKLKYSSNQSSYSMSPGENQLVVTLNATTASGLQVKKIYSFVRNNYLINVAYQLKNAGATAWTGSFYGQDTRHPAGKHGFSMGYRAYSGTAISSKAKPYEKVKYDWLNTNMISRNIHGGWLAIQQQYFLTAWVPNKNQVNHYYSHTAFGTDSDGKDANTYTMGVITPETTLAPGKTATMGAQYYAGPEIAKVLKTIAPGLDLTIDYGWLWPLSKAVFWVMEHIHSLIGNWGWSIVLTTLLIKIIFYKFSESSYKSMGKMRDLAPKMTALKERYKDDKQKLSQATMELYKKEKVNPAGGCLPMLIQIPFFIALYYVLIESVQLRQAPFIFWIVDLSVKDPYYVLPILMGITMFIQQKMTPTPMDSAQAKAMMILPVVFTAMFLNFPAGLTLYWLTNNLLTIGQQWLVMHRTENAKNKPKQISNKKAKKA
ncbi:MAG: membrane protein insertase YidC [Coxiellaceae bacterium]|nr:membrane protein insertase YidC [Coxiellaceae bacterium]